LRLEPLNLKKVPCVGEHDSGAPMMKVKVFISPKSDLQLC